MASPVGACVHPAILPVIRMDKGQGKSSPPSFSHMSCNDGRSYEEASFAKINGITFEQLTVTLINPDPHLYILPPSAHQLLRCGEGKRVKEEEEKRLLLIHTTAPLFAHDRTDEWG